jgi:hypothetical protein
METYILISIVVIIFYLMFIYNIGKVSYVESYYDGREYLVQNTSHKQEAAILLSQLTERLFYLRDYLIKNIDNYPDYREYILLLQNNFTRERTQIYEGDGENDLTSYSVNKGEELVFCLKSKERNKLHNINLLMYVAIHEMAHMACPEIGHGNLFKKIFRFLAEEAIKLNLYQMEDYASNPVEYCGMKLTSSILS